MWGGLGDKALDLEKKRSKYVCCDEGSLLRRLCSCVVVLQAGAFAADKESFRGEGRGLGPSVPVGNSAGACGRIWSPACMLFPLRLPASSARGRKQIASRRERVVWCSW